MSAPDEPQPPADDGGPAAPDPASASGGDGDRLDGAAERAVSGRFGRDRDKTVLVVVVAGGAALIAIAGIAMIASRRDTAPQAKVYTPRFDVAMSSQEELRSFTKKTSQEVTELSDRIRDLAKAVDGMAKRQDDQDDRVRKALAQATEDLQHAADAKLKSLDDLARLQKAGGLPEDAKLRAVLDEFRANLASSAKSPADARARALAALREAGVPEDRIRDLLAEASQVAGRVAVGAIAEPPMSDAEVATLPAWVRPLVGDARELFYGLALNEGRFYPDQGLADLRRLLEAKDRAKAAALDDAALAAIAKVARVRRENLPPPIETVLPYLLAQRDQKRVAASDRDAVARLVWSERERYEDATPGQMLSLCQVVARTVDAVAKKSGEDTAFRPLDAQTAQLATEVVTTAVANAIQLGKDQAQQAEVANRALANYLDTARVTADEAARKAIVTRAMAAALKRRQEAAPVEAPAPKSAAAPAEPVDADAHRLFFGPIAVDRGRVAQALVLSVPGLLQANGVDPTGANGAAALVGSWEQVPRIVAETLPPYLGKPMGGREFATSALPQVIWALRLGQKLGGIPLPVGAAGGAAEQALVRGVAIGAIYGPFLDDETKAKAAAIDAERALEADPPLSPALAERLASVPATHPYERIAAAYATLRPGRLAWQPARLQDLIDVVARVTALARPLAQSLAGRVATGEQGQFEENVRLLAPLAVAARDDGRIEPERLLAAVRDDLRAYAVLYAAEARVAKRVADELLPRYALAAGEDGGNALVAAAAELAPATVHELWRARQPSLVDVDLAQVADALADEALPLVEARLVQEAVLSRVEPRLKRAGALGDGATLAKALARARERARELVKSPYTPARIDGWATAISDECRAILDGRRDDRPGSPQANPGRKTGGLWPAPTMLPTGGGGALIGGREQLVRTRKVVIPANSYANAHLQTGVDAEIGGKGNTPVMLQVDFDWVGPANSRIVMRGCRVSGYANALAGPERVSVDLKTLSYVFPSGREIDAKVDGYVADNINGQYGALGVYRWNVEKVMPLAVLAGGFEGAGDALKSNTQTTLVTQGGATVNAVSGSQLQNAAYGGVSNGFGVMASYFKDTLKDVHPSVSVVNGQRLSVVLLEPVVVDVPEEEFPNLVKASVGSFAP